MPGGKRKTITKYLAIGILVFDQLTKYVVSHKVPLGASIPVLKNIFHITHILNRGAAFGIFKNLTLFFIIAAIAVVAFILMNLRQAKNLRIEIALFLILSGALGNLIDRLRLGAVIDFLDFRIWPVFNIADTAITIGAILLAYSVLFKKTKHA